IYYIKINKIIKLSPIRYLNLSNNKNFSPVDIKQIKAYFNGFVFVDIHIDGQRRTSRFRCA
ncbi:MAG: hypothetical protein EB127_18320, partial [Alphaproteobacteria bacterium]|nr:hypothetical protein [Alphaproteobacteria bacterium]